MKAIFLVGYMGSGKTTLGRELAAVMGKQFVDLDIFIENRFHKTIRDIFAERGESGFRKIEHTVLEEVASYEDVIVACGGGTPCHYDNMAIMNGEGLTVYLQVPVERLAARLCLPGAKAKRPLIADKSDEEVLSTVKEALVQRVQYYEQAAITFDATDIETAETNHTTAERLAELLRNVAAESETKC